MPTGRGGGQRPATVRGGLEEGKRWIREGGQRQGAGSGRSRTQTEERGGDSKEERRSTKELAAAAGDRKTTAPRPRATRNFPKYRRNRLKLFGKTELRAGA